MLLGGWRGIPAAVRPPAVQPARDPPGRAVPRSTSTRAPLEPGHQSARNPPGSNGRFRSGAHRDRLLPCSAHGVTCGGAGAHPAGEPVGDREHRRRHPGRLPVLVRRDRRDGERCAPRWLELRGRPRGSRGRRPPARARRRRLLTLLIRGPRPARRRARPGARQQHAQLPRSRRRSAAAGRASRPCRAARVSTGEDGSGRRTTTVPNCDPWALWIVMA